MRDLWHPLILTTLFHLLALEQSPHPVYSRVIVLSTTLSVAWHLYEEPRNCLEIADYTMAAVWLAYDIIMSVSTRYRRQIVALNMAVMILNRVSQFTGHYEAVHSFWHLVSAGKAYMVAWLLQDILTKK